MTAYSSAPKIPALAPSHAVRACIQKSEHLFKLSETLREELAHAARKMSFRSGSRILRNGSMSDGLYLIESGRARVLIPGRLFDRAIQLEAGDLLGESCVIEDEARHADVVALSSVGVFFFPRKKFIQLIGSFPELEKALIMLLAQRFMANLMQASPLFAGLCEQSRHELTQAFVLRYAKRGESVHRCDPRRPSLFVVLAGQVSARSEVGDQHATRFGPGSVFGPSEQTVRLSGGDELWADTAVVVLDLASSRWQKLCARPDIAARFGLSG